MVKWLITKQGIFQNLYYGDYENLFVFSTENTNDCKKNVHNYLQQETPPICFDEPSAENSRLRVKIVQKENVDVDANDDQFRCIQN